MTLFQYNNRMKSDEIPSAFSSHISFEEGKIIVSGHRVGLYPVLVAVASDELIVSFDFNEFAIAAKECFGSFSVSKSMIAHLLQNGLCPTPYTAYEGIYMLTLGDQLEVNTKGNFDKGLQAKYDFPFLKKHSQQNQIASTNLLREKLAEAVSDLMDSPAESVLMLSSGKDSTAIAIALADGGYRDTRCLTYVAGTENDEDDFAAVLCKKLNLPHEVVQLPETTHDVREAIESFFSNSFMPSIDNTQIPYVLSLYQAGVSRGQVFDGSGNDVYVGHIPNQKDRTKFRLNISRIGGKFLYPSIPHTSMASFFLKSKSETCFPGYFFSPGQIGAFLGIDPSPIENYWQDRDRENSSLDIFDFRAATRGRHYDNNQISMKARSASSAAGACSVLPWAHESVSDYYFNLPEDDRFDEHTYTNKILLRKMLREAIDYPDQQLGKRYFEFQLANFLLDHRGFVLEEILSSKLWQVTIEKHTLNLFDKLEVTPRYAISLHALFMISGWYNHSRYL